MNSNENELLKRIQAIEIKTRMRAKQDLSGLYQSAFRGSGIQFRDFRPYVYGDDPRHISWTVSARSRDPVLKTFEEERERSLFLITDCSRSLRAGPVAARKAETLAEVSATLAVSAYDVGDRLGLLLFTDQVEKIVRPGKGKGHLLQIIREIIKFQPKGKKTSPTHALEHIEGICKKHSILVLMSDMEKLPDSKVVRHILRKHELIAVGVEDSEEISWPHMGFVEVESAETSRPATIGMSERRQREFFLSRPAERREKAHKFFQGLNVPLLWLNTNDDILKNLRMFFRDLTAQKEERLVAQLLEMECPPESTSLAQVGEVVNGDFVVISVDQSKITLGPLKAGELEASLPCTNGQLIKKQISVKAAENADQEAGKVLGLWTPQWPIWMLASAGSVVLLVLVIAFLIWRKRWASKIEKSQAGPTKLSPKERLLNFQKTLKLETHPQSLKEQLHLVVRSVKDYLIERLDLDPEIIESSTQSESLGHIKVGLQRAGLFDPKLVSALEAFLHEAEVYRFSAKTPGLSTRDRSLHLIELLLNLSKPTTPAEKTK